MERIKVSVVIAVYNSDKYLEKTLDSVLVQSLQDIEIILVDDGSTDASYDILKKYESKDSRITVLQQLEPSDGAALARNMGVSHAKGEYISVLDADDFFDPDMLKEAYEKAVDADAEVVMFDGDLYDEKLDACRETGMILRKDFLPVKDVFNPSENAHKLFFMTIGAAWNVLFKRELIERENLRFYSFHHADDLGYVYLGFATAKRIAILPKRLLHYRINNLNSQAATLERWPEAAAGAIGELYKALKDRYVLDTYRVAFTEMALHYFDLYLNRMTDYKSFENLYLSWKNRYANELELCIVPDEDLVQNRIRMIRTRLMELSPGEYLFEKENRCGLFASSEKWRETVDVGSSVILYCAGKQGRELFTELLNDSEYKVVAWCDAKHKEYGYPVSSPEGIKDLQYDYILVSIESKEIFERIYFFLIDLGVPDNKIVWTCENGQRTYES